MTDDFGSIERTCLVCGTTYRDDPECVQFCDPCFKRLETNPADDFAAWLEERLLFSRGRTIPPGLNRLAEIDALVEPYRLRDQTPIDVIRSALDALKESA